MLKNKNIPQNDYVINKKINNIFFSFGKEDNINENCNNESEINLMKNDKRNKINDINDSEKEKENKRQKCNTIFKLLNINKFQNKENNKPRHNRNNINPENNPTKPKLEIIKNNYISPAKTNHNNQVKNYKLLDNKNKPKAKKLCEKLFQNNFPNKNTISSLKDEARNDLLKLFNIKSESDLPFEIKYLLDFPEFNYDFEHQNDNNSNYQYIIENFIDILLKSYNKKIIINSNIRSIKEIQQEINFHKRNILISWLTEINYKYIKDQNILFTAIKYLDYILYHNNISINDFQLIGILCFNLALKMEDHHKVFYIEEIISLIGGLNDKEINNKPFLIKKIELMENNICNWLDFDFIEVTSVLILKRLIQLLNIHCKRTEELFISIAFFFLEVSLYDERFYELDDFDKALSSLILAKEIMKKYFYKIGTHNYLEKCAKIKKKEIKNYYYLCIDIIKELKKIKYGNTIFIKYQQKEFQNVINNYLNVFILYCVQNNRNGI